MKIAIVTTFNQKLYDYYAHRFMSTYNWPFDLYVYHEGWTPDIKKENIFYRDTLKENDGQIENFIHRNLSRNIDSAYNHNSEIKEGANYKLDAIRFCYKVFSKTHFMLFNCNYDYVFWVDADTFFLKPITKEEVEQKFLPKDCAISFIDRPSYYSECGFVGYNLTHDRTRDFIYNLRRYYTKDLLFKEREWHDSYVWDCVRKKYLQGVKTHNLAPKVNKVGNPWPDTYMAEYCSHLKGKKRKDAGVMLK